MNKILIAALLGLTSVAVVGCMNDTADSSFEVIQVHGSLGSTSPGAVEHGGDGRLAAPTTDQRIDMPPPSHPGRLAAPAVPTAVRTPTQSDDTTGAAGQLPEDPCDCTTDSCLQQWVDANLGCNVCAVITCGDQVAHSCLACQ